ncbi:MAG: flagellar biosynthesis anti-sigma factor FlgM [Bdellovibrionales bacterium]|nr:flagellar biosynthesis anti-sigma factor FlgM [Bdellovibrionales bacterium]
MKIRRTEATDTAVSSRARELREHATQESLRKKKQEGVAEEEGTVHLGLGRAINRELDATELAAERRARVEELKAKVRSGEYRQPDGETLARSVAEELTYEILTQ